MERRQQCLYFPPIAVFHPNSNANAIDKSKSNVLQMQQQGIANADLHKMIQCWSNSAGKQHLWKAYLEENLQWGSQNIDTA